MHEIFLQHNKYINLILQIKPYETLVLVILKVEHLDSNWDTMSLLQQKILI